MSENMTPQANQPQDEEARTTPAAGSQPQSGAATDLSAELREMGQQLEAALRAALESERAKQIQRDLAGGVRELSHQLQAAVRSLQTNPRVHEAEERGRQAISQARQSKVIQDVQETVVAGVAQLNDQLRKLVERLEAERTSQPGGSPSQQVPIDHEPPATGETTRLDDRDQTTL